MDFFFSSWRCSTRLHKRWHSDGPAHDFGAEREKFNGKWDQLGCFYCPGRSFWCCQAAWLRSVASPDASGGSKTSRCPVRSLQLLSLSSRLAGARKLAEALSAAGRVFALPCLALELGQTCKKCL